MTETLPYANLYYQNGNSDKVYKCHVSKHGEHYIVYSSWGRRGSTLTNNQPIYCTTKSGAIKEFNKIVEAKRTKGYKEEGPVVAPTKVFMLPLKSLPKVGQSMIVVKHDDLVPLDTGRRIKDE